MTRGARVFFRQTCRDGYGFQRDVPAVFDRESVTRAALYVLPGGGGTELKRLHVSAANVRSRVDRDLVDVVWERDFEHGKK